MKGKLRITIATGIYPPEVGGPAYYAQSLAASFASLGHTVKVVTYGRIKRLPTGVRHTVYFFRLLPVLFRADVVIALDTFSVGFPAVIAGKITRTPIIVRTGGDFLWEFYIERTGKQVLLSDFYIQQRRFTGKEKIIFSVTRFVLRSADKVVFSTAYQRDIFIPAYGVDRERTCIIENYYGPQEKTDIPHHKRFVCFTRKLKWKNLSTLKKAFALAQERCGEIELETGMFPRDTFLEHLKTCYAVVLVSLGDVSPNMILEAVRYGKPFILTAENGLKERLRDTAVYVDPLDEEAIAEAICTLSCSDAYEAQRRKVLSFSFIHTYDDIAREFINLMEIL